MSIIRRIPRIISSVCTFSIIYPEGLQTLGQVSTQIPCMAQHGGRSFLDDAQVGCPLGRRECQGTVCGKGKGGEEKQGAWYFCYLEMGFGLVKVLPVKQIKTWNPRADHGRLFSIFVR